MKNKYHTSILSNRKLSDKKNGFTFRKTTRKYCFFLILSLAIVYRIDIHAEGSGNWKGTQTNRQSSLWVPGNNAGNSGWDTRGSILRPSAASNYDANHRLFVYVKAGETVYFSFRSSTSSNLTWYYDSTTDGYNTFFPTGTSGTGRVAVSTVNGNLQGRTSTNTSLTQTQAVAGPSAIVSGGYASNSTSDPGGKFTNNTGKDRAFWVEMASPGNNGFEISEWDITVTNGTTKQPGRTYSKYWSIYNGLPSAYGQTNTSSFHDNFGFYVPVDNTNSDQIDDYYIKYISFGKSNAGYGVFFANDSGPLNNTLPNGDPDIVGNRKSIKGTSNRYQYPLFVTEPDESIWKTSLAPIASTDVRFRRKPDATGGEAYFKVTVDTPGTLDILVDIDRSGNYSAGDVQLFDYFDAPGTYEVYWDGKDASGNIVPAGTEIRLFTSANFYPVHFPVYDMEQSLGITMKNVRPVATQGATVKLFWDHSNIYTGMPGIKNTNWFTVPNNQSGSFDNSNVQSPAINTTGVDSPGNIWWANGDNGIGNNNTFNVYAGSWMEIIVQNFVFNWDKSDIEVRKTVNNPTPAIGSEVTFTIKVTNKGLMYTQNVTINDLLPSGYEYISHTVPMGARVTPAPIGSADTETWNQQQTTYNPVTGKWTVYDIPYNTDDLSKNERVLTITAKVLKSGVYNNTAEGYPDVKSSDSDHSNNSSTVIVNPTNTTNAVDDINVTYKNTPVSGNVLTNDFDMEGHIQTVTTTGTITTIEGGNVQINADGTYVYTPKENFTGSDSFTYTICDDVPEPFKACDRATVSIIVNNTRNYWHGTIDNNWAKTDNWTANFVPAPGQDIEFATESNNGSSGGGVATGAAIRDLHLDTDRVIGNLINNSDVNLLVTTENQLTINGTVQDNNPDKGTIIVKTSTDKPTGTLIFSNPSANSSVNSTVEFYNKAYECSTCGFYKRQWQYFGIPVKSSVFPSTGVETINQWVEPYNGDKWRPAPYSPDIELKAFKGYEMTNSATILPDKIYSYVGSLNVGDAIVPVTKTSNVNYSGMNLLSNSYTGAIPISTDAITFDSGLLEETVYLFNTGTRDQWRKLNGSTETGISGGQYQAVPFHLAGQGTLPDRILSMHAFMLNALKSGQITLKYDKLGKNELINQLAWRSLKSDNEQLPHIVMDIIGNTSADRVWLFENPTTSTSFDNGWDGYKLLQEELIQVYVSGEDKSMYQIATVPEVTGTTFGVKVGKDQSYKLNMSVTSDIESRSLLLRDLSTGYTYPIINNAEYTINRISKSANNGFEVISGNSVSEDNEDSSLINITVDNRVVSVSNLSGIDCTITIYDLTGRILANKTVKKYSTEYLTGNYLPNGVYIVKVTGNDSSVKKTSRVLVK